MCIQKQVIMYCSRSFTNYDSRFEQRMDLCMSHRTTETQWYLTYVSAYAFVYAIPNTNVRCKCTTHRGWNTSTSKRWNEFLCLFGNIFINNIQLHILLYLRVHMFYHCRVGARRRIESRCFSFWIILIKNVNNFWVRLFVCLL